MPDAYAGLPQLPERLKDLVAVAANLAWSWDPGARDLFAAIDRTLWSITRHNPLALLQRVDPARLARLANDSRFLERYDRAVDRLNGLASTAGTWFASTSPQASSPPVAYFCAEFALHNS